MLQISQNAEDLVIAEEVGSRELYEKKYRHPEWPGGSSGVTIGIGYDVGYVTKDRVGYDWAYLPSAMVGALRLAAGFKGAAAQSILPSVRGAIDVSFSQAMDTFDRVDKPRYLDMLQTALPNCDKLDPNCVGALWSLVYNRGVSFDLNSDRYEEMRAIKVHMIVKDFDKIPGEFRSMKRLWTNGLVGRREREARLFERGLLIMSGRHLESTAPRVATRTESAKRNATAVAAVGSSASGATTVAANDNGYLIGTAIVLGFVVCFFAMVYVGRHKLLPKADPT